MKPDRLRERETERQRQRDTERERDRQTDRERQREKERERERERERGRERDRERETDKETFNPLPHRYSFQRINKSAFENIVGKEEIARKYVFYSIRKWYPHLSIF